MNQITTVEVGEASNYISGQWIFGVFTAALYSKNDEGQLLPVKDGESRKILGNVAEFGPAGYIWENVTHVGVRDTDAREHVLPLPCALNVFKGDLLTLHLPMRSIISNLQP